MLESGLTFASATRVLLHRVGQLASEIRFIPRQFLEDGIALQFQIRDLTTEPIHLRHFASLALSMASAMFQTDSAKSS